LPQIRSPKLPICGNLYFALVSREDAKRQSQLASLPPGVKFRFAGLRQFILVIAR